MTEGEEAGLRKHIVELEQERDSLYADIEVYIYVLRDVKQVSIGMEAYVPPYLLNQLQALLDEDAPISLGRETRGDILLPRVSLCFLDG